MSEWTKVSFLLRTADPAAFGDRLHQWLMRGADGDVETDVDALTIVRELDANRWAAFTDDELEEITACLEFTWANTTTHMAHDSRPSPMVDEISAELERRRA